MAKRYTRAQMLANPRLRAKLPDSALTPDLLAKRRQNERNRQPITPGSSVTYGQAARDREAAVALKYGPEEARLNQHQAVLDPWFKQYQDTIRGADAAAAQRYGQAQTQLATQTALSSQADTANRTHLDAQRTADAALRGATAAPDTAAVDATNSRRQMLDAFAAALGQQALAERDYYGARKGVGEAAKIGEGLAGVNALKALAADKGAYRSDYMAKRADDEHTKVLEDLAFKLKASQAAADAQPTPSERKTEAELKYFDKHGYWPSTGKPKSATTKPKADPMKSPARLDKIRTASGKAVSRIEDAQSRWDQYARAKIAKPVMGKDGQPQKDDKGNVVTQMVKPTPDDIRARLRSEKFTDPEIHLALTLRAGKKLTKKDIETAHNLGIRVPRSWLPDKPAGVLNYGGPH